MGKKYNFLIIIFIFCILLIGIIVSAQTMAYPRVTLAGRAFELKYSTCTPMMPTCINEYYRLKEAGYYWTELFTVHSLKKVNDIKEYSNKLLSVSQYSDINYYKETNTYIVSFLIPFEDKGKKYIEQNIFKIIQNPNGKGAIALQYARRHSYDIPIEQLSEEVKTTEKKYRTILLNMKAPNLYEHMIQNW